MTIYIKLGPPISSGSFGTAYYVKNIDDEDINKRYVLKKINLKKVPLGQLYVEIDSLLKIREKVCRKDILCITDYYIDFEDQTFNLITDAFIDVDLFPLTLRQYLNNTNRIEESELLEIMYNLTNAFSHLHQIGVGHGDIKPENILINNKLQIHVIDFGFSCTRDCTVGGTIAYESPEMLNHIRKGNVALSLNTQKKSDVFSLGLVFFELANRFLPLKFIKPQNKRDAITGLIELYKSGIRSSHNNSEINHIIELMLRFNKNERISLDEVMMLITEIYVNKMTDVVDEDSLEISPMDVYMNNKSD
jgi:serine/threonine protein kinase